MRRISYILFVCCLCLTACEWSWPGSGGKDSDADIKVCRFDKLLNEYVSLNSFSALQKMNTEYPQETKILVEDVLTIGEVDDSQINTRLKAFYADSSICVLMKDALQKFDDMKGIERDLTKGFSRLKEEVPPLRIPRVYAQISALNQSVVVGDSILGFSIDKYMGADYPLYKKYYYRYQRRSMEPSRIVPDCLMYYLISEYPLLWEWNRTLLDHIMHSGKMHWIITNLLGYDTIEEEIGYTEEEAAWCKKHGAEVWKHMLDNGHLDGKELMLLRMYLSPAPYTACFGNDLPFELGAWVGAKIIEAYMRQHKDVTIAGLLEDTDYRKMLANTHIEF